MVAHIQMYPPSVIILELISWVNLNLLRVLVLVSFNYSLHRVPTSLQLLTLIPSGTPIFASIINRINDERIGAGKSPVGFLNYALYKNPSMLNDVTNGSNPGCSEAGFSASVG